MKTRDVAGLLGLKEYPYSGEDRSTFSAVVFMETADDGAKDRSGVCS